jgi:hypothetical protein
MSPQTRAEFKSPTFWLSVAGIVMAGFGWAYTFGIQNQKIDTGASKDAEQDIRIEKLGDKVDNGFNRMADKIDSLRIELKSK